MLEQRNVQVNARVNAIQASRDNREAQMMMLRQMIEDPNMRAQSNDF